MIVIICIIYDSSGLMIDDLVDTDGDAKIGEKMPLFAYIYIGMGFCE